MRDTCVACVVGHGSRRNRGRRQQVRQRGRRRSRRSVPRSRGATRRVPRVGGRSHPWGPQPHMDDGFLDVVRAVRHDDHGSGACPTVATTGSSIAVGAKRRVADGRTPAASAKAAHAATLKGRCQDGRRRSAGDEGHRQPRLEQSSVVDLRVPAQSCPESVLSSRRQDPRCDLQPYEQPTSVATWEPLVVGSLQSPVEASPP